MNIVTYVWIQYTERLQYYSQYGTKEHFWNGYFWVDVPI